MLCLSFVYTMGKRKTGDTVHPGRECELCTCCGLSVDSYRHPENWNEDLKDWLVSTRELQDLKSCLCRKCEQSLRRKWIKWQEGKTESSSEVSCAKKAKADIHCVVTHFHASATDEVSLCSENVSCSSFSGCTVESVAACFGESPATVTRACEAVLPKVPLCRVHYSQLYR